MRVLPPSDIHERLTDAGFDVTQPNEMPGGVQYLMVADEATDRHDLQVALDVLCGGYIVEVTEAEPNYEIVLTTDA